MTALNASAARNAVAAQPRPSFASLHTTPIDATSDPQARLSHREALQLVCEIRTWARQFNAPDAKALAAAMERLLLWLWTEMDESRLRLTLAEPAKTPEKAAELGAVAMQFWGRWLGHQKAIAQKYPRICVDAIGLRWTLVERKRPFSEEK